MVYALGVDIGGTKIASVIIDENYNIISRYEVESIPENKETMFVQVIKAIDKVMQQANMQITQISGMGIGIPGKVDRKNGIAIFQNNLPWENFPIINRLSEHYNFTQIKIDNDVHLAALAEWKISNLTKGATFVYATVSTGVSCATIHDGEFLRGAGFAGELGLLPVETNFTSNRIGRLELVSSGPSIEEVARERYGNSKILTKDVFTKFYHEDEEAKLIIQSAAKSIAHGLYSIICLLDPQKITIGGGVANNNPILIGLIQKYLSLYVLKEQESSLNRIGISHFKGDSGVIGAGILGLGELN